MKSRWWVLACLVVVGLITGALGRPAGAARPGRSGSDDPVRLLRIYYRSPVLVGAGETVTMPVQVVCVTGQGKACEASVSLGLRAGTGDAWRFQSVPAGPRLTFDLSAPVARAAASSTDRSVAFFLQAKSGGLVSSLPANDAGPPLRFYVASHIRPVKVPAVPFGRVRKGTTVLTLAWGSGRARAGLSVGRESPTLGPSSFDVDARGHVHLLDPLQDYVAEFRENRLVRLRSVQVHSGSDLAVGTDGTAYVAGVRSGVLDVIRLGDSGTNLGAVSLGPGVLSQVRIVGRTAYAELLPLDAWVRVPARGGSVGKLAPIAGRPLADGARLLRVGTERSIRLGCVRGGKVHGAVELRSSHRFGEVALAESDGAGGYVVVVRVWRSKPSPSDQYQVIQLSPNRVTKTFAVSSRSFADASPLSRFRLGPDGRLYQLVSSPAGIRIVRFELRRES